MEVRGSIPDTVIGAGVLEYREKTLLRMLEEAEADPNFPEFDRQQVVDEMKQYLWAGTETTALTLAWSLYLLSQHPEALGAHQGGSSRRVRRARSAMAGSAAALLYAHGDPGDHAAVPADLGADQDCRRR